METSRIDRPWRCGAFELQLGAPLVMGIINATPDSFSDGGDFADPARAVTHGHRLVAEGAHILDVGGESTRPGSDEVTPAEEIARIEPVIRSLAREGVPVSVDTRHASVAQAAVDAGACIINDVSGFRDPEMRALAAECDAGLVVMHMLGEPKGMQTSPAYRDVVAEVADYLAAQAALLEADGVARERIVLDPGIGFGKTTEHNLALLRGIPALTALGYPVLIGASRKRFIGEITGVEEPKGRVAGSVAVALQAIARGAAVVRVHDVAQTVQAIVITSAIEG